MHRKFNLPWLCYGDFNEILSGEEKLGGGGVFQGPKGKLMDLGRWSMFVVLKTWDIVAWTLRGVICKKGKIVYI